MNLPPADDWTFGDWIEAQTKLQVAGEKGDPAIIPRGEPFATFATWNGFAACAEIHEAVDECRWKPWDDFQGRNVDRTRVIDEVVDALHFIGNILRSVNATGEEVTAAYKKKAQKNLDRWQAGYDALASKCPGCGRDFGESDCVPGEFCQDKGHEVQAEDFIDDPRTPGHAVFDLKDDNPQR